MALVNQTLEAAYPVVAVEGELANFRVSKNRWVYFDLQDELASVKFFGTVYSLPGPLQDGLKVRVVSATRAYIRVSASASTSNLSRRWAKAPSKKLPICLKPNWPPKACSNRPANAVAAGAGPVGLITAAASAAYADFIKILDERWGGVDVRFADVYVQGRIRRRCRLVKAIDHFNGLPELPEVLVITRGGGSAEDLAAFSDERVVRAVAASRVPTLVAVGHEVDISLAELAADMRASTPTNAAQLVVPTNRGDAVVSAA